MSEPTQRMVESNGIRMHIAEAERDHTGQRSSTRGDQLPEAEVVDEQDAFLPTRLLHNSWVW